jgi:cytidylate kinase
VIVAIDGPAGAGKSTVAQRLSRELGLALVDTGALYRCVALAAGEEAIVPEDDARLTGLMSRLATELRLGEREGKPTFLLGRRDVSDAIRTPAMSNAASAFSARPVVRQGLLGLQRALARGAPPPGAVLEGRDIGTVVFPDADAKFFLTAASRVRAERRFRELQQRGLPVVFEQVLADQEKRDRDDQSRALAPLRQADDAELVDSTSLTLDQVVTHIEESLRRRGLVSS